MDYCITTVQKHEFTRINVLINTTNTDSCSVTLCHCVSSYWHFEGPVFQQRWELLTQQHSMTSQKTWIICNTSIRPSSLTQ